MLGKLRKNTAIMKQSERLMAALTPADAVVVDLPSESLRAALDGVAAGDPAPAARLLADTRERQAWDERSRVVWRLSQSSLRAPEWLDHWQDQDPDSPDALLVRAQLLVALAWERRSPMLAKHVSDDQWRGFAATLEEAKPVLQAAVERSAGDPAPWAVTIWHGVGSQVPREVFDGYREQFMAVAPDHYDSHAAALQFLTEKWHGSHEESFAYAGWAATLGGPYSRLRTLPLVAEFEHLVGVGSLAALERRGGAIAIAVTMARQWADAQPDQADPGVLEARNLLALVLFHMERNAEAYAQMLAVGPRATSHPWLYFGDARERFLTIRERIVTKYATELARPGLSSRVWR